MDRPILVALVVLSGTVPAALSAVGQRWEAETEWVESTAISLLQLNAVGNVEVGSWETALSAAAGSIGIDYEPAPFDFQGVRRSRRENSLSLQVNARRALGERWTLVAGAGAARGYTNYRSVWLDEYFRQQFGNLPPLPGLDTYRRAAPRRIDALFGARWAYRPGSGFAQLTLAQVSDRIAPGYEIDFNGLRRLPDTLATTAATFAFENVVSRYVRSLLELRATKTSEREWRLGAEYSFNTALAERWIARWHAGYVREDPDFEASYAGVAIEFAASDHLSFLITGRSYRDTGEIENALLFTSAAPSLRSRQWRAGVRWTSERWSVLAQLGSISASYAPTNSDTDFFQNLYRDRDWLTVQLALARAL